MHTSEPEVGAVFIREATAGGVPLLAVDVKSTVTDLRIGLKIGDVAVVTVAGCDVNWFVTDGCDVGRRRGDDILRIHDTSDAVYASSTPRHTTAKGQQKIIKKVERISFQGNVQEGLAVDHDGQLPRSALAGCGFGQSLAGGELG